MRLPYTIRVSLEKIIGPYQGVHPTTFQSRSGPNLPQQPKTACSDQELKSLPLWRGAVSSARRMASACGTGFVSYGTSGSVGQQVQIDYR